MSDDLLVCGAFGIEIINLAIKVEWIVDNAHESNEASEVDDVIWLVMIMYDRIC